MRTQNQMRRESDQCDDDHRENIDCDQDLTWSPPALKRKIPSHLSGSVRDHSHDTRPAPRKFSLLCSFPNNVMDFLAIGAFGERFHQAFSGGRGKNACELRTAAIQAVPTSARGVRLKTRETGGEKNVAPAAPETRAMVATRIDAGSINPGSIVVSGSKDRLRIISA